MRDSITWVGIDDHKVSLTIAVQRGNGAGKPQLRTVPNEDRALRRFARKLERESPGDEIRICYEAGPNGFGLRRRLEAVSRAKVEVIAPTLTPRRAGTRVKTDSRDATKLVQLYRAGELTAIAMPNEEDESARDLVRTLQQVKAEALRKRHHILKYLLRRGRVYRDGRNWTRQHREWLRSQKWDRWTDEESFGELMYGLRELEDRRDRLASAVERLAEEEQRATMVGVLRCFHGINTAAAVALVVEIFDIQRFPHPRKLMSYLGLTAGVIQSADREYRTGITKAGNRFARHMLGQIAWHYRHKPRAAVALKKRREGQPLWAIEIADRAHKRLYRRYWALTRRDKPTQKAMIAVARELVAFIWEAMTEVKRRELSSPDLELD